jgi:hypothetical protein
LNYVFEPAALDLAKRKERFSLSAFCEVGGAKWGEGGAHFTIFLKNSLALRGFRMAALAKVPLRRLSYLFRL